MTKLKAIKQIEMSDDIKYLNEIISEYKKAFEKLAKSEEDIHNDYFTTLICNCVCNHLGVKNFMIYISVLDSLHYVLVVELGTKYYLLDLSYAKYFRKHHYKITKKNINKPFKGSVDFFINRNEESASFARKLLKKGYFECTSDNMKMYCDSFVLVNYNKNRKNKDLAYTTTITGEEYFSSMILRKSSDSSYEDNQDRDRGLVYVKVKQQK